jgi:hypothetical protein
MGSPDRLAARKAGISVRTAYRRLGNPEFRRRLQALRAEMVQRAAGTLIAAALEASFSAKSNGKDGRDGFGTGLMLLLPMLVGVYQGLRQAYRVRWVKHAGLLFAIRVAWRCKKRFRHPNHSREAD